MFFFISRKVKFVILFFLLVFLLTYSILFIIKVTTAHYMATSSIRRANYRLYIENPYVNNQANADKIDYMNVTEYDSFLEHSCPVEDLKCAVKCLDEVRKSEEFKKPVQLYSETKVIYYHTLWMLDGDGEDINGLAMRVKKLNVMSYLSTQNLLHTKLCIWTLKPLPRKLSMHLKALLQNYIDKGIVEFKQVQFRKLCSVKILAGLRYNVCAKIETMLNKLGFSAVKDFMRFLLLMNYGGIYVDNDIIYLNDLKPFWFVNFAYRWPYLNDFSASVIGIRKELDDGMREVLNRILLRSSDKSPKQFLQAFHPFSVRDVIMTLNNGNLYKFPTFKIYHCVLFDPAWLCNNGMVSTGKVFNEFPVCRFQQFFDENITKFSIEAFFNGAFTYHIHYNSEQSGRFSRESYFYHFEDYFKSKLNF